MSDSCPQVSVLMPVYNGARFLREAMDSVLAQSFLDFEFVIIDDCSTDVTPEILRSYDDSRIVLLRNEQNLRLPATLNRGLKSCRAPLISRVDADDICLPELLARQVALMGTHPEVGVASTACQYIDEEGRVTSTKRWPVTDDRIRLYMTWDNPMIHSGAMYRRDLVLTVGGYNEDYWCSQDYELWSRLANRTNLTNLGEPMMKIRSRVGGSITAGRGTAGDRLGHSIATHLLSAYLGESIPEAPATAFRRLLKRSEGLDAADIRAAMPVVEDMLTTTRTRETRSASAWFKRVVAGSFLRQGQYFHMTDSGLSWEMLCRCLSVSPSRAFTPSAAGLVARLLFKKPLLALWPR